MTKFALGNTKASRLTAEMVFEIRRRYAEKHLTGETQENLAREFRVSLTTIRNVVHGVSWQHVPLTESDEVKESKLAESQRRLATLLKDPAQIDDTVLLGKLSPPATIPSPTENTSDLASLVEGLHRKKAELAQTDNAAEAAREETRDDSKDTDNAGGSSTAGSEEDT